MLAFYVHTHWGYNNPYAARTWTLHNWRDYLSGLQGLGYDTVQVWPLLDSMPLPLTASDRAFLDRLRQVIDLAHDEFDMRTIMCANSNVMGNETAAEYEFEVRPYFASEAKLDPSDPDHLAALRNHIQAAFAYLWRTDGMSIIDSDPGGFVGSTNREFVDLMCMKIAAVRELNPQIELFYWMHVGWESYNQFWQDVRSWDDPHSRPEIRWDLDVYVDTLEHMVGRVPEPWGLYVNNLLHFQATEQLGLQEKRLQLPYGLIEGEPTFPLTNWDPERMDRFVNHYFPDYSPDLFPRGRMGNAQTHCLQLPHTYLFAHLARGGTLDTADLSLFAADLLPDCAGLVATGWRLLEEPAPEAQMARAQELEAAAAREQRVGRLSGLLFGDGRRFLIDLAMNLRVRSRLHALRAAIEADRNIVKAVRDFLDDFRPYQERLGFQDAYGGPLYTGLNEQVLKLHDPVVDEACQSFTNWANPAVRNGALTRLLDALDDYCERAR
jgi:hypothetical protein